jgi:YesN/AraC family two-component response regulator
VPVEAQIAQKAQADRQYLQKAQGNPAGIFPASDRPFAIVILLPLAPKQLPEYGNGRGHAQQSRARGHRPEQHRQAEPPLPREIHRQQRHQQERGFRISEKKETSTPDSFTHIVEYIHSHFAEKILLDDVAKFANFSKSYLIRLFKKNTGKTFSAYLNSYRIYKACEMLDLTQKNILEISEACGFENVAYFIKIFKSNTGLTPHKYRNR